MSISHHQTASGRPLRVSPAWVGGAASAQEEHLLPVREAVWVWNVRRYARLALWALPAAALLYGWTTLGIDTPPGPLVVTLAADWLSAVAMIALAVTALALWALRHTRPRTRPRAQGWERAATRGGVPMRWSRCGFATVPTHSSGWRNRQTR